MAEGNGGAPLFDFDLPRTGAPTAAPTGNFHDYGAPSAGVGATFSPTFDGAFFFGGGGRLFWVVGVVFPAACCLSLLWQGSSWLRYVSKEGCVWSPSVVQRCAPTSVPTGIGLDGGAPVLRMGAAFFAPTLDCVEGFFVCFA